jgi:predicted kinase
VNVKELIMTVGLPGSGKTAWALGQGLPVVSPDEHCKLHYGVRFDMLLPDERQEALYYLKYQTQAMLNYGFNKVILDACNLTIADRNIWANKAWRRIFEYVYCPLPFCKQRVAARDLDGDFSMDELEEMAKRLEVPSADEFKEWELV